MKIGILGAMLEEVSTIKKLISIERETSVAGRDFIEGKIENIDIVLTFSRWGKVAAASTASILINKFNVESVLFIGVAGAVNKDLNIGDMVVGSGLYQHDMDARPFFDRFQIPLTSTTIFTPNKNEISKAKLAAEQFLNKIDSVIRSDLLGKYSIFKPKVYAGLIASGDKFVSSIKDQEDLLNADSENTTLAVEMEGAAVAQVCDDHGIPYIVVRTISDKADHSAVIDFPAFIKDIASSYSAEFVSEYLRSTI